MNYSPNLIYGCVIVCLVTACAEVEEAYSPLMQAAVNGDVVHVEELLESGVPVDQRTGLTTGFIVRLEGRPFYGVSALMLAVDAGHNDTVDELLSHSANPSLEDSAGRNSWDRACAKLNTPGRLSTLKLLTEYTPMPKNEACHCLNEAMGNIESVSTVLAYYDGSYCIVNNDYYREYQPAARAIYLGEIGVFRFLEQQGFVVPDDVINLAVESSFKTGNPELLEYLLQSGYQNSADPDSSRRLAELLNQTRTGADQELAERIRQML
jgi:hypothetical protein